jgi:hypothetical protein
MTTGLRLSAKERASHLVPAATRAIEHRDEHAADSYLLDHGLALCSRVCYVEVSALFRWSGCTN